MKISDYLLYEMEMNHGKKKKEDKSRKGDTGIQRRETSQWQQEGPRSKEQEAGNSYSSVGSSESR